MNKSPIKWLGNKSIMTARLLALTPEHEIYAEPFFGGGALFFSKKPAKIEVVNDTNDLLVNFYRVIRDNLEDFNKRMDNSLHSRSLYEEYEHSDWKKLEKVEKAFRFFYIVTNAWCGLYRVNSSGIFNAPFCGGLDSYKKNSSMAKRFYNRKDFLVAARDRLKLATIENVDYVKIFEKYDSNKTFFFLDPPYNTEYQYSGTFDHDKFKRDVEKLKGKWLLTLDASLKKMFSEYEIIDVDIQQRIVLEKRINEKFPNIIVKSPGLKPAKSRKNLF